VQISIDDQIRALIDSGGRPVTMEEITARPKASRVARPRRAARLGLVLTAGAIASATAVAVALIVGSQPGASHPRNSQPRVSQPGGTKEQVTTAALVRHVAVASAAALDRSGKVTISYHGKSLGCGSEGSVPFSGTETISFSRRNYNNAGNEATGRGYRQSKTTQSYLNRVVNGQAYDYFAANHGLRWYHVLGRYAVAKLHITDPRALLRVLTSNVRFVKAGTAVIDGVRTTKLRATSFSGMSVLKELPGADAGPGTNFVTALTVWADSRGVVRQMRFKVRAVVNSDNLNFQVPPHGDTIGIFSGKHAGVNGEELLNKHGHVVAVFRGTVPQIIAKAKKAGVRFLHLTTGISTEQVNFTDIGKPQHIVVPPHAITTHGVG